MGPVIHSLSGFVLSGLGFRQKFGNLASWIMIIASMFPDVDAFTVFLKKSWYLKYHRRITHSLLGIISLSAVLALVFGHFISWIPFGQLWLFCFLGMALHIIFDLFTSYGIQILYPFSARWYFLDLDTAFDLWCFLPLLIGASGFLLFPARQEWIALAVFLGIGLNCLLRGRQRRKAKSIMDNSTKENNNQILGILPVNSKIIYNPFWWKVVASTRDGYRICLVNTLSEKTSLWRDISYPREMEQYALKSKILNVFLFWSRFPYGKIEETNSGRKIFCSDLRFNFTTEIEVDFDGDLIRERLKF